MSEYLTYILWRQHESTLLHQLERQRVLEERLTQQDNRREEQVRQEPARASAASLEESADRTVAVSEADFERVS